MEKEIVRSRSICAILIVDIVALEVGDGKLRKKEKE